MLPIDPRLEPLLDLWDKLRGEGRDSAPEELTQDPELLPGLRRVIQDIRSAEAALGGGPPSPAAPAQGVLGRYEALVSHDEGGMGVVYRARDVELGREVAYKVIRTRLGTDRRALEKFLNEAQVTARLQHPGIVPVYGLVRDDSGRPAYAMRFVEGTPLATAVQEFHAAARPVPTSRLAWQSLLRHFVRLCETIDYAHSHGVLHRDLSPRNVLLVGDSETLVIDWGLALDSAQVGTNADDAGVIGATRAGTVAFTAPEVWDPQGGPPFGLPSDIYSIGALLYLILTGYPPYSGGTPSELVAKVRQGPPPEASDALPGVPRPLAKICARAMSRGPERRYTSAGELACDIELWLAGERVSADQEPWPETALRWLSRHRTLVGMAGVVLLAVAVGGPIAFFREHHLREQAETAAARADQERRLADAARQHAARATDEIIAQGETIGSLQASLPAAKAVLDRGARHLEDLARDAEPDPLQSIAVTDYYLRAGRIRYKLNQLPEAADLFAKATELARKRVGEDPTDAASCHRLAMSLREWGVTQAIQGRVDRAAPAWAEALQVLEPVAESEPAYRHTLAKVHMVMGNLAMFGGRAKEAREAFERARVLAARLVTEAPSDAAYQFTLAEILSNEGVLLMKEAAPLGQIVTDPKKLQESQDVHQQALVFRRHLVEIDPDSADYKAYLAASLNHLGNVGLLRGEKGFSEAESNYREALALLEPLSVAYPGVPSHRIEVAQIFNNLNQLYGKEKRWVEAEALARLAVEHFTRLVKNYPKIPEHSSELGVALEHLADTLRGQDSAVAANDADFRAAVEFARASALSKDDAARSDALASKAVALLERIRGAGYFQDARRVELLRTEAAFQPLQRRPDYEKLLADLGQK
jgi:tetratricopeptide (TPR) repeat protein/tRNA A-37 threonylcarbamoyl transferase component Bud32